ncbi:Heat shock protein DnaJ N-terminal [Penicillium concentricum]|uniref:Heat shock protein DnaJ N-terminal n=1 Tax=Penicillium concentricum TaxID=293559 RepID=A0A9W9RSR3_9EURO|nr:Heat shock protein DnaJ N-terminal [Penicillium concentricum]KAJ5365720.1 Heat shock protein DnaJ N-terminal [Penicillium concentricum]
MVKSDVRKDYYADLGLQPSAEAEDIKKQFRKLALKYHPDRNPGREVEFNAKFQAIQAANEILSDPSQRLKYDTDRLRAGYGKCYGPTKANTQRKTQPPTYPPRPAPTASASTSSQYTKPTPSTPSAGARRYASHARAGPQQFKQQDNAQTRADAFRGFNNMRGAQAPGWQGFDPSTGRATGGVPGPGAQRHPFGTSAQSTRPKSAFEAHNSHSNAQSFKKKQGFAPGVAGGDEPMARNTSAYSNNSRAERMSSQYFKPAVHPTAKKPASPEPPEPKSRHSYTPEFERPSRSYAQAGKGEKTFFSSTGLGRSATMRTPSGSSHQKAHTGKSSPASGRSGRYRSASPSPRRNPNNYDSTSSSEGEETMPKPKAVPKSRLGPHQTFADFYNAGTASPGNGMDFTSFLSAQGLRAVQLPNGSYVLRLLPQNSPPNQHTPADKDGPKGHTSDSAAFPKSSYRPDQQAKPSGSSSSVKYVRYAYYKVVPPYLTDTCTSTDSASNAQRPQSAAYGRSSTSDLHKKFSADDWRDHLGQFEFLSSASPSKESLPRSPASQNRGRTNIRNGPTQTSSTRSPLPNPFGPTPLYQASQSPQQPPTPFAQAKFSADSWSEQLRNLSWNVPEAEKAKQTSNAAPPRSPKKQPRAATKVRSTPQSASVATEADEAKETINGQAPGPAGTAAPDVEEMDLDDDLPTPPSMPPKIPVGRPNSGSYPDLASQAVPDAPPVKKPKPPQSTDSRTPLFNLDNLRNTVPFTNPTGGGIENLEDFHTTLPFESQAKQQRTTKNDIRPRVLQLPNPPKRPWAPKPVFPAPTSKQLVLPREKWNWYVSAMATYMLEWNAFNGRMLTHFNARQEANETGLAPGWISAVGDSTRLKMNGADDDSIDGTVKTSKDFDDYHVDEFLVPNSGKGGFSAYLRGIEEDIQVRKHWDVACELHRECILDLGRLREWIRDGGKVA